jgi:hypothetical protein
VVWSSALEEELLNLVIDRAKWGRGDSDGMLLNPETGKMCCLGFLARECGLAARTIESQGVPSSLATWRDDEMIPHKVRRHQDVWNAVQSKIKPRLPFKGADAKSEDMEDLLAAINDTAALTTARRERLLTKEFAKVGVKVTFVGEQA